ncbi:MAG: hypothetical protein HY286_06950 [Planctomycetes bacterium]|nr:hypothetical protein [Planctomycetota bacterium]
MRRQAFIRKLTGRAVHLIGTIVEGELVPLAKCKTPVRVEISEEDGAFFLFRFDLDNDCVADTWHKTLDEAMRQAEVEYGILESDWRDI